MAKARQCDRCGGFYQEYGKNKDGNVANGIQFMHVGTYKTSFNYESKDLCPRCMKELKAFLNMDKEERQDSENKPLIQKLKLPYYCMDEYGNTDRDIVTTVNEIIDVINEYR